MRKVFLSAGDGVDARLVMICRETDVNGDGNKDVDPLLRRRRPLAARGGRPQLRRQDGHGHRLPGRQDRPRKEFDENRDGKIDTKIFFDNGKPLRAERDLAGRSTASNWQPDRWEYYEDGRMVRMGTDLDGDGTSTAGTATCNTRP